MDCIAVSAEKDISCGMGNKLQEGVYLSIGGKLYVSVTSVSFDPWIQPGELFNYLPGGICGLVVYYKHFIVFIFLVGKGLQKTWELLLLVTGRYYHRHLFPTLYIHLPGFSVMEVEEKSVQGRTQECP